VGEIDEMHHEFCDAFVTPIDGAGRRAVRHLPGRRGVSPWFSVARAACEISALWRSESRDLEIIGQSATSAVNRIGDDPAGLGFPSGRVTAAGSSGSTSGKGGAVPGRTARKQIRLDGRGCERSIDDPVALKVTVCKGFLDSCAFRDQIHI
jgi:hypothetical protein